MTCATGEDDEDGFDPEGSAAEAEPATPEGPVTLTASEAEAGTRLDRFLADQIQGLSRTRIKGLIDEGCVEGSSGTIGDAGLRVKPGDRFTIRIPPATPAEPVGEAIPLTVAYEDKDLIVIDKPAGLVVHPAAGHSAGTLVNALIAHCGESLSGIGGVRRPGIVHRLDKETSGLLVVAKTDAAHQGLADQFAAHGADGRLVRTYFALVWGVPPRAAGAIDAPLGRSTQNRTKMAVVKPAAGRHAVTHYALAETFAGADGKAIASLLQLELETGRTHQIRVHLAHIGHPVMGDPVYGAGFKTSVTKLAPAAVAALDNLGRQALHAAILGFEHPRGGRALRFESPLPPDMAALLAALRPAAPLPQSSRKKDAKAATKPKRKLAKP